MCIITDAILYKYIYFQLRLSIKLIQNSFEFKYLLGLLYNKFTMNFDPSLIRWFFFFKRFFEQ